MGYSAISNISEAFNVATGQTNSHAGMTADTNNPNSKPNNLSRFYGGHSRTSHPYINGYWQFLVSPPCKLFDKIAKGSDNTLAAQWFHATAEGFTPPSRNLNKVDLPAQGGVGSSWVSGQSLMRTFSITHREYRDLALGKLIELWTSIIIPHIGVSELAGYDWEGSSYKGEAFVILTKPTGHGRDSSTTCATNLGKWKLEPEDIEEVFYFDGVWPENTPVDSLAQDISSNDIVQYTVNYSFDGWYLNKSDDDVVKAAIDALNNWSYQETYDTYTTDLKAYNPAYSSPQLGTSTKTQSNP